MAFVLHKTSSKQQMSVYENQIIDVSILVLLLNHVISNSYLIKGCLYCSLYRSILTISVVDLIVNVVKKVTLKINLDGRQKKNE